MWMDDDMELGDRLNIDEMENSLGIQNVYSGDGRLAQRFSSMGDAGRAVFNYDDTLFPGPVYPDELPPRPVSQMEYEEIVNFHLRK